MAFDAKILPFAQAVMPAAGTLTDLDFAFFAQLSAEYEAYIATLINMRRFTPKRCASVAWCAKLQNELQIIGDANGRIRGAFYTRA